MLKPDRLMQLMIELIFLLLGGLLVWLGLTRHIFFDRSGLSWTILSAALILWGLRALFKPGQWWLRWQIWTRGLSLVLLGAIMLAIAHVPTLWVGKLLALAGIVLATRGVIGAGLAFRPR
jgi:hypothetical protein